MSMERVEDPIAEELWKRLLRWYEVEGIGGGAVTFSGGKDSTLVLDSAVEALDDVVAVIVDAEVYPEREIEMAVERAEDMGVDHIVIKTSKLEDERFRSNPEDRCYYCKKELFEIVKDDVGEDMVILDGTNASDVKGHRPGLKAVEEYARAPLLEVGLSEEDVREILKWRGRKVWNRPSFACLATRFPTGKELTEEGLKRVERGEERLFKMGFTQLRVRNLGGTARIEVYPEEMDMVLRNREKIVEILKDEGYERVSLDLEGYTTGSISPDE